MGGGRLVSGLAMTSVGDGEWPTESILRPAAKTTELMGPADRCKTDGANSSTTPGHATRQRRPSGTETLARTSANAGAVDLIGAMSSITLFVTSPESETLGGVSLVDFDNDWGNAYLRVDGLLSSGDGTLQVARFGLLGMGLGENRWCGVDIPDDDFAAYGSQLAILYPVGHSL